ncbi:MAG: carbohydrate ABC transporter permease [Lachnospiraceae bacterium]
MSPSTVLSGLQSIDDGFYEAATVDGADYWQKMFQITIPLVRPSLTVSTVLNIIYVFNSFPIIWTITKGDPANRTDTLVTYLYKSRILQWQTGRCCGSFCHWFPDPVYLCKYLYDIRIKERG